MHLKLDENNNYRIMQVTDLHFGEDAERDDKTISMIRDIIRKEQPDFLAVTGDLISGQMYDMSASNSNFWDEYFETFINVMNGYDIPWGFVPGFHDYETGWTDHAMMQKVLDAHLHSDVGNNYSYLGQKIDHGFNFSVPIEANDQTDTEVGRIWFFGTGKSHCYD